MEMAIGGVVLLVVLVLGIRIAFRRAAEQRAAHDARMQAMARTYLAAAKKKAAMAAPSAAPTTPAPQELREERECPFCAELILKKARMCKHCGREVEPAG